MRHSSWAAWLLLFAFASTCARRSSTSDDGDASVGGSGTGGSSNPSDAVVPFDRDLSDVSFTYEGPLDDGSVDRDAACVDQAVPALPAALDMYLMVDRSKTMRDDCNVGKSTDSPWCYSVNALAGFFAAPTSNGMGVALGFTPHGTCSAASADMLPEECCWYGDCCLGGDDALPEVMLTELPDGLPTLVEKLNAQAPLGVTSPLQAALLGLTAYTTNNKREGRQMIGIIMTDGEPNGCEKDLTKLSQILSDHRANTGQLTFVIGTLGTVLDDDPDKKAKKVAALNVLETLALAGGAAEHDNHCVEGGDSPCHYYDVGDGNPTAFVDALQQIQRSTVGCRFSLPTTDAGIVDPNTLVVEWSSPSEPVPARLTQVKTVDDCGRGWYADPDEQGQFVLCPRTCEAVQSESLARIDLIVGCMGS